MRVLLIYPTFPAVATQPPLGLMYIASSLRAHGYSVTLWEGDAEAIKRKWNSWSSMPDWIGITCMTSMYHEIIKMRDFFYSLNVPLVFGGVHATILPDSLIGSSYREAPQFAIMGEGEQTMLNLVNGSISFGQNKILQGEPVKDLDALPYPARDLMHPRYLKHPISMMAARGCKRNCAFCQPTLKKVFGSRVRGRSVGSVLHEMDKCYADFGSREFEFFDDSFTSDADWVYRFCDALNANKEYRFSWRALSRVDMLDYDMLKTMKRAGLSRLSLGIESGSQYILNSYNKGTTVEQNHQVLKWCYQLGIKVHGFFMIGALEEIFETIRQTRQFIKDHRFETIFVTVTTPTPCTGLYYRALKEGRLKVPWEQFDLLGSLTTTVHPKNIDQVMPMKLYFMEAEDILKERYRILREFYLRKLRDPRYLPRFVRENSFKYAWRAARNVFH